MGENASEGIVEEPALEELRLVCEGFMASIAHNVLKAMSRLGLGTGSPESHAPSNCAQFLRPHDSGKPSAVLPHSVFAPR